MRLFSLVVYFFVLCQAQICHANNSAVDVMHGDSLYAAGKYQEAIEVWNTMMLKGYTDPDLYYNIGCAESMVGNIPSAILNFERSLRYHPGAGEIKEAIRNERAKMQNAVIPVEPFFLVEKVKAFIVLARPGTWAIAGLVAGVLGMLTWLSSLKAFRKISFISGRGLWFYLAMAACFLLLSLGSYALIHSEKEAIVFTECDFREAPSPDSPLTRLLPPGEKGKINDELSGWYRITLLNMDQGWVRRECMVVIDIP